jgi:hypothetical protein
MGTILSREEKADHRSPPGTLSTEIASAGSMARAHDEALNARTSSVKPPTPPRGQQ